MKAIRFITIGLILGGTAFAASTTELYTEQAYLAREARYQGNLRVRQDLAVTQFLYPYLQAGGELITALDNTTQPAGGSHVFAGPGVRLRYEFASLYVEPRVRQSLTSGPNNTSLDFRSLVVLGKLWVTPVAPPLSTLVEAYSETLLTSYDKWNVIEAAYLRGGFRYGLGSATFADLFLEPFVTLDRHGYHYNNRADLKLSARFETLVEGLKLSLTGSLLANTYLNGRITGGNPYADRTMGFRLLAVVGGVW